MFGESEAFSGFSTDNIDKAEVFYRDVLGLDVTREGMGMLTISLANGGTVMIYPKDDHEPAVYTVLNFPVPDIDDAVEKLTALGIEFERYDEIEADDKGISRGLSTDQGPDVAWFKDPGGNILAVMQLP